MCKYIHIGYPKNFSTSLQSSYFSKHPQILHLGAGVGNNIGYVDDLIEIYIEVYLKYCKNFKYREKKSSIEQHFANWFQKANNNSSIKAVGVSSEHFSFPFTNDVVDQEIIAKRLLDIFGKDTKIIMIIRNQMDLLHSIYNEGIRVGYSGSYADFIDYIYMFQERNFLYSYRYDLIYKLYEETFGRNNIGVFIFENYRNDEGILIEDQHGQVLLLNHLDKFLGLDHEIQKLSHFNQALSKESLQQKRLLNESNRHDLGNCLWNGAENHRLNKYLTQELQLNKTEKEIFQDVITKRKLIEESKNSAKSSKYDNSVPNPEIFEKIADFYHNSNYEFVNHTSINLPDSYFKICNQK